jgi:hypothetical protein
LLGLLASVELVSLSRRSSVGLAFTQHVPIDLLIILIKVYFIIY